MRNKLFTQPGCPHCQDARAFLNSRSIVYTEYNVKVDEEALRSLLALTGRAEVPALFAGYQAVVGFNQETWSRVLQHASEMQAHDPYRLPDCLGRDPHDDE